MRCHKAFTNDLVHHRFDKGGRDGSVVAISIAIVRHEWLIRLLTTSNQNPLRATIASGDRNSFDVAIQLPAANTRSPLLAYTPPNSMRARASRSLCLPHLLGITLCTSLIEHTSDSASLRLQHVAYFLGVRCVRSRPPLVVGTWNLLNVSTCVICSEG